MNLQDLIHIIRCETEAYTGPQIGFGAGTDKDLNALQDKVFPLVWVFTNPNLVSIEEKVNASNIQEQYTFSFAVLNTIEMSAIEPEVNSVYAGMKLIGDGIIYNLRFRDKYQGLFTVQRVTKSPEFKKDDDNLTGIAYQLTLLTNNKECNYPFA